MKKLILICSLALSTATFANNQQERNLICNAVDKLLEIQQADMALDIGKCLKNKTIKSTLVSEGTRVIEGKLVFLAPGRPAFKFSCEVAYIGTPEIQNIVGGLEVGVTCN